MGADPCVPVFCFTKTHRHKGNVDFLSSLFSTKIDSTFGICGLPTRSFPKKTKMIAAMIHVSIRVLFPIKIVNYLASFLVKIKIFTAHVWIQLYIPSKSKQARSLCLRSFQYLETKTQLRDDFSDDETSLDLCNAGLPKSTLILFISSPVHQKDDEDYYVLSGLSKLQDCLSCSFRPLRALRLSKTDGQVTHTKDSKFGISNFMLQPGGLYNIITFRFLFENYIVYLLALWSYITEHVLVQCLLLLWFKNADSCIFPEVLTILRSRHD